MQFQDLCQIKPAQVQIQGHNLECTKLRVSVHACTDFSCNTGLGLTQPILRWCSIQSYTNLNQLDVIWWKIISLLLVHDKIMLCEQAMISFEHYKRVVLA